MFDAALEEIADDVANKVGEMEQFMEMSSNFMESVDLQNGLFQDEGLRMLEEWEEKSTLLLMGENQSIDSLDLGDAPAEREMVKRKQQGGDSYNKLFD